MASKSKSTSKKNEVAIRDLPEKTITQLASAVYEQLKNEGCRARDILALASMLISFVTAEIRGRAPLVGG